MLNKLVSLKQLISLKDDPKLSEIFIRYYSGLSITHQYKHQEILDIFSLLSCLNLDYFDYDGFIYGYVVPQLSKEFDLIKICNDFVLNIELKSQPKNEKDIEKQLIKNTYYLKLINDKIYSFTFVSSIRKLYKLSNNKICEASFNELADLIKAQNGKFLDLDKEFSQIN